MPHKGDASLPGNCDLSCALSRKYHALLAARVQTRHSHSASGLMHDPWRVKDLEAISQGLMLFEPAKEEKMRMNVRLRMERAAHPLP